MIKTNNSPIHFIVLTRISILFLLVLIVAGEGLADELYPPYEPEETVAVEDEIFPGDTQEEQELQYIEGDPFGFVEEVIAEEPVVEDTPVPMTEMATLEEDTEYAVPLEIFLAAVPVYWWQIVELGVNAPGLGVSLTEGLAAASEAGIALESMGTAGAVAEAGAVTGVVAVTLYGIIIAEVAIFGTELYLLFHYDQEIEETADEYVEAALELGQTEEEAIAEYEADLYTENSLWDNFVDIYCLWC